MKVNDEFRQYLVESARKSQEDFDKTVLSLSGGALGISFVFLKDIVGVSHVVHPNMLLVAWSAWGLSTLAVLASFYFSHQALCKAIDQIDAKKTGPLGGLYSRVTSVLNAAGASLFVIGVLFITIFAGQNFAKEGEQRDNPQAPVSATPTTAPAAKRPAASAPATTEGPSLKGPTD
jgi:hypothetical protein